MVAGPNLFVGAGVTVDTLRNIRALRIERHQNGTRTAANPHFVIGVTDFVDHITDDLLIIYDRFGGNFTGNDGHTRGYHRFASDPAFWVLSQKGVENTVGDSVCQLIGVAHADRLAGK